MHFKSYPSIGTRKAVIITNSSTKLWTKRKMLRHRQHNNKYRIQNGSFKCIEMSKSDLSITSSCCNWMSNFHFSIIFEECCSLQNNFIMTTIRWNSIYRVPGLLMETERTLPPRDPILQWIWKNCPDKIPQLKKKKQKLEEIHDNLACRL